MSIQGPASIPIRPFVPQSPARPGGATPQAPGDGAAEPGAAGASTLWDLLTEDERTFFAQQSSLGSVTYGRARASAPAPAAGAPLGQRIDVKG